MSISVHDLMALPYAGQATTMVRNHGLWDEERATPADAPRFRVRLEREVTQRASVIVRATSVSHAEAIVERMPEPKIDALHWSDDPFPDQTIVEVERLDEGPW